MSRASRIQNRGTEGLVDFYTYGDNVIVVIADSAVIEGRSAFVSWLEDASENQASHDVVHLTSGEALTYWSQYIDSTAVPLVSADQRPTDWYNHKQATGTVLKAATK